jgi:hypothetical protein
MRAKREPGSHISCSESPRECEGMNSTFQNELPFWELESQWTPKLSQPYFEGNVRSPLTLPKMGLGNLPGLLKIQNKISGVKTPCIEVFFILLERS